MTRGRASDIIGAWRAARGEGPVAEARAKAGANKRRGNVTGATDLRVLKGDP